MEFVDTSEECTICLSSLDGNDDDNDKSESSSKATITLQCGHRYHLECIKEQLRHAQPNPTKRLVFAGCRCAKCGRHCHHTLLDNLTRKTDQLRAKVDDLIKEMIDSSDPNKIQDARRSLAFYLCRFCGDPYFGGTIECADSTTEEDGPPEDCLCPKCSPKTQTMCRDPAQHRPYHVYKCRYCCQVASHVCYGSVHFCNDCHDRNTQRVQQQRSRLLEPIPCPGRDRCPHPFPEGKEYHANGPSPSCEQVYYCAWCESASSANTESREEPGSYNLLLNPSGAQGQRHWRRAHPRCPLFAVETSELPFDHDTTTNFVSSFQWSVMAQVVDLRRHVRVDCLHRARLEASVYIMARTDCASVFRMELHVLNEAHQSLVRQVTPELEAPAGGWERVQLNVGELPPGAVYAMMVICGKDVLFWQGFFGSKVTRCRLRVLGNDQQLEQIMLRQDNNHERGFVLEQGARQEELKTLAWLIVALLAFFWLWL